MERSPVNRNFYLINNNYENNRKEQNKRIMDLFNGYDHNPFIPSLYCKNKKYFDKMLLDYEKFYKKKFGNCKPEKKIPEFSQQLLQKLKDDNEFFFKKYAWCEFPEKDYFTELVLKTNLDAIEKTNLGKNPGNENDYSTRSERVIDDWQSLKVYAKRIQDIFREKRTRERLYVGFDKSKNKVVRVYVNEYDENKKIKSLKFLCYFLDEKRNMLVEKDIKQLLHINSISKEGAKKIIDDIIEKALLERDESIKSDALSEIHREKAKMKINNFDKKTLYEDEKTIKEFPKEFEDEESEDEESEIVSIKKRDNNKDNNSKFNDSKSNEIYDDPAY
jgi:hypothetical protein